WPWRILAAHYERRNRAMQDGELVIFDVGCEYNNYVSDMGRTFPVSGKFTDEQKNILLMETAVSDAIIAAIKPGVTFADLKKIADAAIPEGEKKYMQVGLFFGHHLGLSTGDPNDSQAPLAAGMVFTVEPWYYNHDKKISVFTEDEVLVTATGAEVLTDALPRTPVALEKMMK
ncbi:MAG: M24 family metallopeptidase, partial [Cyclobacteriaceae bacterium]